MFDADEQAVAPQEPPPGLSAPRLHGNARDTGGKQAVTVDSQARSQLFWQIGKILNDKLYWVSMWDDPDWWAFSKKLKDVRISGGTPFWNAYNWDLAQ